MHKQAIMKQVSELTLNEFTVFLSIYSKNEYEFDIDREIDLISLFFDLTKEEVEDLPIKEYNDKVKVITELQQVTDNEPYYVFTLDGIEYKTQSGADGQYFIKVKDRRLIELYSKANPEKFLSYIAAIIFSNGDYSEEGINARAEIFADSMQMKYLSYHFNQLK